MLREAVKVGTKRGLKYPLARALLDLAAVCPDAGDEHRRRGLAMLLETGSVVPYAESWLLGDRYDPRVVAPANEPRLATES